MSASNLKKKVQRACTFVKRCKEHNFCSYALHGTIYHPTDSHQNLNDILDELNSYDEEGNAAASALV